MAIKNNSDKRLDNHLGKITEKETWQTWHRPNVAQNVGRGREEVLNLVQYDTYKEIALLFPLREAAKKF